MTPRALLLLLALGPGASAEPRSDEALRSLLRVRAAAEAARQGRAPESTHRLSLPYEGAQDEPSDVVVVPAAPGRPPDSALSAPAAAPKVENPPAAPVAESGRISGGHIGLYPESDFELTTGRDCGSCLAPKEGAWYFLDEVIAVPKAGEPSLVWIGSTRMFEGARIAPDGKSVTLADGTALALSLVPQYQHNASYYDASTTRFFQGRTVRIRGELVEENGVRRLVARTIWPEDFKIEFGSLQSQSASTEDDIRALVQQDEGGAQAPFLSRLLWSKGGAAGDWAGRPVLGVMLNGAQGDDDEAHYGHFSLMTGRFGPGGELADWMFSNFYSLDQVSEKAILPALIPMDKYLADLNSGQSYYRPTYVLAAVLKDDRTARSLQERYRELYAKYYAHEVVFDRTTKPCTGLIMDEVRGEGWNVPARGPSNVLSAGLLSAIMAIGSMDPGAGKEIWNTMRQETTRLSPRVAFEAVGEDLLNLGGAGGTAVERRLTPFEKLLQEDLEAVLFIRLPQIPSSRAFGRDPAGTIYEYFGRVPLDRSKWQVHPTPARPFPPPH